MHANDEAESAQEEIVAVSSQSESPERKSPSVRRASSLEEDAIRPPTVSATVLQLQPSSPTRNESLSNDSITTRPDTSIFLFDSTTHTSSLFDVEPQLDFASDTEADARPSTPEAPMLSVSAAATSLEARLAPSSPYKPTHGVPSSQPTSSASPPSSNGFSYNLLYPFSSASEETAVPPEYLPNLQPLPPVFPRPLQRSPSYIDPRLSSSSLPKDAEAVESRMQSATQQIQAAVKSSLMGKVKRSSSWVASGAQDWVLGATLPIDAIEEVEICEIEVSCHDLMLKIMPNLLAGRTDMEATAIYLRHPSSREPTSSPIGHWVDSDAERIYGLPSGQRAPYHQLIRRGGGIRRKTDNQLSRSALLSFLHSAAASTQILPTYSHPRST